MNVAAPPAAKAETPAVPVASASPTSPSNDATTDELRQQAARLQEQLSSLLFRAEHAEKKIAAPAGTTSVEAPKTQRPARNDALENSVSVAPPVISKPGVAALPAIADAKPVPSPIPIAEIKPLLSGPKSNQFNLKVEEVKIPSWLAPLARDGESQSSSSQDGSGSTGADNDAHALAVEDSSTMAEERSASQTVVFGGQLLGGASERPKESSASGSKTGLIFGLAATAALVIGAGVWYGLQSGNFLATKSPVSQSNLNNGAANQASSPVASTTINAMSSAPVNSAPSAAAVTRPVAAAPAPANVPPAEANNISNPPSTPEAKATNSTAHAAPAVEQPKKPVLGDVHLATPNVNRNGGASSSEAAPTIDAEGATPAGDDPLVGITAADRRQPVAPAPIGGDVKPAQLLKSVPPVYPPTAKTQRVGGDVKIDALIDAEGNVTTTKILSGPVLLHQAAAAAVKQWKYQPAYLDGKPTAMHLTVTVQFRLQ
jgi:protein TonB